MFTSVGSVPISKLRSPSDSSSMSAVMTATEAEVEPTPVMPSSVSTSTSTGPIRRPFETTLTSVILMTAASPVVAVRASLPAAHSDCQFRKNLEDLVYEMAPHLSPGGLTGVGKTNCSYDPTNATLSFRAKRGI